MKIGYYSNQNMPRSQVFRIAKYDKALVFMFRTFDVYIFWGDSNADIDYDNK